MALILKKGIFYHVPKTGGVWVRSVLKLMRLVEHEYHEDILPMGELNLRAEHVSPLHADKSVVGDKPSFAFIRNPIAWYKSIWKYKSQGGWTDVYVKYKDKDFNVFMKNIMDISPGFLTRMYKEFDGVDYLGKQENLENDLISILETLGEEVDYDIVGKVKPLNTSDYPVDKRLCEYDPKILERMKKLEKWIFEKYYPEEL